MRARLTVVALLLVLAGPAATQTAPPPAAPLPPATPAKDPFGEEMTLPARPMLAFKGQANWDEGFDRLKEALRSVYAAIGQRGLKASGPPLVVYLRADDTGFDFEAGVPLETRPAEAGSAEPRVRDVPAGRALRFTHRGSFDNMDSTYEALTNHLDEKRLEVKDMYMEEYLTDPLATPDDQLHVLVYVFPR
jgi:effector-binding domain-containing protein